MKKRQLNRRNHERIIWFHGKIAAKTYPNTQTLRAQYGISERTAHRDVDYLRDMMNAPLAFDRKKNGFYYTDDAFTLPAVWMSEGELLMIYLSEKVMRQYAGAIYEAELRSAFEKICSTLPESISVDLESASNDITIDPGPARDIETEIYKQLIEAIRARHSVEIIYHSANKNEISQRKIDPYHLHNQQGDWYLIAYDPMRADMRDFALSRIRSIAILTEKFEIHPDFNREAYLSNQFGGYRSANPIEVAAKFDSYQARWIREKQWPGELSKEELEDGSLILTFKAYNIEAVMRWLMQYGSHVQALQPQELIDAITNEVNQMQTVYKRRL